MEPFRIIGNIYYVGASDVSAYLITTPAGHILLDTGFQETLPLIESGVKKLGFRMDDIRLLLASHAHYDHAGAIAAVKSRTKARLLMNPREVDLFARGGKGDFAFGDAYAFPPAKPDGLLQDGGEISLGNVVLTAHFTPGHAKGCTTYSTTVQEARHSYSLTISGYFGLFTG
jgi:metallo-beta-lactamase class B